MLKRILGGVAAIGLIAASTQMLPAQDAPKSIKVGYVISLSGPQAAGALLTTVPNYRLWVDEVNKAGGIMLKKYGKRIPIEVSEVDDRSNNEDMVRLVERMIEVEALVGEREALAVTQRARELQPAHAIHNLGLERHQVLEVEPVRHLEQHAGAMARAALGVMQRPGGVARQRLDFRRRRLLARSGCFPLSRHCTKVCSRIE